MIKLNASALPRVLACLGSTQFPHAPEIEQSESAREGEAAHHAAECALKGLPIPDTAPNGHAIDAEMREHAASYKASFHKMIGDVEWSGEILTRKCRIGIRIDNAGYDAELDCLFIDDYKYGWRIVDTENNAQLIAGAVAYIRGKLQRMPAYVQLGIYQPRPYHPEGAYRPVQLTAEQLIDAWTKIETQLDALPSDVLATGPHCEHCPGAIMGTCPAYLAAAGNAVDVATRGGPMDVTPAQYARELVNIERAAKVLEQRHDWLKDIAKRALKAGTVVPGWALEENFGKTVWTAPADVICKLTNVDILTAPGLVTAAEAKRRGMSEDVIAANTKRPLIGEKLVRRDPDAYVRKKLGKKPK